MNGEIFSAEVKDQNTDWWFDELDLEMQTEGWLWKQSYRGDMNNGRNPLRTSQTLFVHCRQVSSMSISGATISKRGDSKRTKYESARFENCVILLDASSIQLFYKCEFVDCIFRGALKCEKLTKVFEDCKLDRCRFDNVDQEFVLFSGEIENTDFERSLMRGCEWRCVVIGGRMFDMHFQRCNFDGSRFACTFNSKTHFDTCTYPNATFTKASIHTLKDRGGISDADYDKIHVEDPVGDLRRGFGGFKKYVFIAAAAAVASPYLFFIATRLLANQVAGSDGEKMILLQQLAYYVLSGTRTSSELSFNLPAVASLVFTMVYYCLRAALVWKTLDLEMEEAIKGVPRHYSLDSRIVGFIPISARRVLRAANTLFYVALLSALGHLLAIGMAKVPTSLDLIP